MMFKVLAIKNVMKRNKESHNIVPAGSQPETIKIVQIKNSSKKLENQKTDVDEDKTIKFPFIMVPSQAQGSVRNCYYKIETNYILDEPSYE